VETVARAVSFSTRLRAAAVDTQRQFVSVDDDADGKRVKQSCSTKRILRPGIALTVESIARNPINAIYACASRKLADQRIDRTDRAVPL